MQKYNEPFIKTSEFAKLCKTNKRTLIHYDEIGLFKPTFTDEKGYRYYSETQCDVFFTITCLKDLGMPLKEIKLYIDHKNPEDLTELLLEQEKKVQEKLQHLKRIEQVIQNKLELVSEGRATRFDERLSLPYIEKYPAEPMLTSPYLDTNEHEELFSAICEHIGDVNHRELNIGHPYGAMMKVKDLLVGKYDQYAYFMTKIGRDAIVRAVDENAESRKTTGKNVDASPKTASIHQKPGGLYAVIYLQGDYYEADEAFEKLLAFIKKNELTPGEFCYKEAVWDELTVEDKEDYITRISIPVK